MRCKNCGFNNPENADVCQKCSAPLNEEKADVETEVTDSWGFLKPSRRGHTSGEMNDEDISELEKNFWPDADYNTDIPRPAKAQKRNDNQYDSRERRTDSRRGSEAVFASENMQGRNNRYDDSDDDEEFSGGNYADENYNDDDYDDENPPQIYADRNDAAHRPVRKLDWRKILFLCLAVSAVIIIVVLIATSKSCKSSGGKSAVEIMLDEENPGNYYIKVHAKRGSVLVYENSAGQQQETTVSKKGYVLFTVPIAALLPNEPIDGTIFEASPVIYIKNAEDGSLEKIEDAGSVEIAVPTFNLSCENPASFECENGMCIIKGKVSDALAGVFINGEQIETAPDGSFEKELKFEAPGEYNIVIEAKKNGFRIERTTLKATVSEPPDPGKIVEISEDFITRASRHAESIEVKGRVPAGTQIAVKSDDPEFQLKAEPTVDAEGNFSFTVNLPRTEKNYAMTIVATLSSGTVIERPFCVQRPPEYTEFVQKCWAFNYSDITKPALFGKQSFVIKGEITEIIEDKDYLKAKLTVPTGETLTIVYYDHYAAASHLEVGKTYTMYGIPERLSEDGMLEVFIWFVQD